MKKLFLLHGNCSELIARKPLIEPHPALVSVSEGNHSRSGGEGPIAIIESLEGNDGLLEQIEDLEEGYLLKLAYS